MNENRENIEEFLFQQGAGIESVGERLAFLDRSCGGDFELRKRVLNLLSAHFNGEGFLEQLPSRPNPELPPPQLGDRYTLLEKLGEGGFGVVWLAEQRHPVKRQVAIKILKSGMDTSQVVARFAVERQTLALMDHPCIAKVFDAGSNDEGRPYFVMELVRAQRITDYCADAEVGLRERLRLFVQVCQAIQHAHQKGIIHRDIKPSNVLITLQDGVAAPKVIDFGIAKATQTPLGEHTVYTQFHQVLGTPAYISPEQALLTSEDIDTRSDIYSLGVVLYELLAGRPPFDHHELLTAGLDEMRRIIREKEPVRPSTARLRLAPRPGAKALSPVDPDLDWIVMKCLEKERARRYQTANALAMDVQRYLANEPIVARPPSATYRVSKLLRRNPIVASLVLLLALAITTALIWVTQAKRESDRANRELSKTVLFLESEKMEARAAEGMRSAPMAWLAARLRSNPNDWAAAARLLSMFSQRSFALPVLPPLQHETKVFSAFFSPDETEIVTVSDDDKVRFWDAGSGKFRRALTQPVSVAQAVYAAGGKRLVVNGRDRVARVYDTKSNALVFEAPALLNPTAFCVEGGTGQWLMAVQTNRTISRWNLETGAKLDPPLTFPADIKQSDYSNVRGCWAVICDDNTLHLRNVGTGQPLMPPFHASARLNIPRFTPDGQRLLVSLDGGRKLLAWDLAKGGEPSKLSIPEPARAGPLEFLPGGQKLLVWDWGTPACILDVATMKIAGSPMDCGIHAGYHFSHSGRLAASFGANGSSLLLDLETSQGVLEPIQHDGRVHSARFTRDDTRLLTGSVDGAVRLWDVRMRSPVSPALPRIQRGGAAAFSHSGRHLLFSLEENGVQVCDAETAQPTGPVLRHPNDSPHPAGMREAWFSPDDQQILTVGHRDMLRLWDATTFKLQREIPVGRSMNLARFSPDGRLIAAGSGDGFAQVWDARTGEKLADLSHNGNEVVYLDFHPNGRRLLTAAVDGVARCWTLPEGKPALSTFRHRGLVWSTHFSPDGRRIVTASADNTARIWDAQTGQPLFKPLRHTKQVFFANFSHDGRRVVTASDDGTARIWDAQTGDPVTPFLRHGASVWQAAFSPDDRILATGCIDRYARLWDAETGLPISEPLLNEGPLGRLSFSRDGRRLLTLGGQPHLWDILQPPTGVPAWFCDLMEAVAGYKQTESGELTLAGPEAIAAVRQRVITQEPHDFYSRWAKWFLVDRLQVRPPPFTR